MEVKFVNTHQAGPYVITSQDTYSYGEAKYNQLRKIRRYWNKWTLIKKNALDIQIVEDLQQDKRVVEKVSSFEKCSPLEQSSSLKRKFSEQILHLPTSPLPQEIYIDPTPPHILNGGGLVYGWKA